MCGQYVVRATVPSLSSSESTFVEIFPPANVQVAIKRIKITFPSTVVTDVPVQIKVYRTSAAAGGSSAGTAISKSPTNATSVSTIKVFTTAAGTIGTIVDKVLDMALNSKGAFEWIARDKDDYLWSNANQRLTITGIVQSGATDVIAEVEYIE